jgi:hypothetical protein
MILLSVIKAVLQTIHQLKKNIADDALIALKNQIESEIAHS